MMNTIHLNQKFVYLLDIVFFCKPYYHCAYTFFITKILILEYKEKCHRPQKSIFLQSHGTYHSAEQSSKNQ